MADDNTKQPLLSPAGEDHVVGLADDEFLLRPSLASFRSSFVPDPDDIRPITGVRDFFREFRVESRKLWYLAGPAVFTSICQYSLGAITQTFAGHLSTIDLAAVTVENSVIAGFSFGVMLGMGSALETLCGQAFGAGQIDMLGVYMQRSWVILNATAVILTVLYVLAAPFLRLIGQTEEISAAAGRMALYMIPQLYAYAMNFPIAKFLQAQSKMMVMAWVSGAAIVMHTLLSWLFMLRLRWGLAGAAAVLNFSWWFIVVAQLVYIFSGACGRAWSGFSPKAFQNLWSFVRLSLASAVMLCLETWYFMALVLFAGYLKNAEVAVDALSICRGSKPCVECGRRSQPELETRGRRGEAEARLAEGRRRLAEARRRLAEARRRLGADLKRRLALDFGVTRKKKKKQKEEEEEIRRG